MTTKQIAEAAGVSVDTVNRKAKELFPGKIIPGKTTSLTQVDALAVMAAIRKVNMIVEPTQDAPQVASDRLVRLESMVEKLCIAMATIPQAIAGAIASRPALPDIVQDYFTIKGYANKVGVQVTYSEAITIGRAAVKLSRELGKEVRKADDERFGQVNSYHASVLAEVFQS